MKPPTMPTPRLAPLYEFGAQTRLGEIAGVPPGALAALHEAELKTVGELDALAVDKHEGNVYRALLAVPRMSQAQAKAAHSALLAAKLTSPFASPPPPKGRGTGRMFGGLMFGQNGNGHAPVQAPAPAPEAPAEGGFADEVQLIPLSRITPSPYQQRKRFDQAELEDLAASIRSAGVLQPITVRRAPGSGSALPSYELIFGERRVRAAGLAGLKVIPALVRNVDNKRAAEFVIIENDQRSDTTALEKATGYAALMKDHGYTLPDLVKKVGKSESTIRNLLRLLDLPKPAAEALEAGTLPPATAALIARVPGEKLRGALALHVIAGDDWWRPDHPPKPGKDAEPLSYAATRELIRHRCTVELKGASFDQDDAELDPGAGTCKACPKRAGNLKKSEPEEYKGTRDDVCTDPECYERKAEAHQKRTLEAAAAKGQKVLTGKAAEQALSFSASSYYVLDRQCSDDPKYRTYAQVLEGKLDEKEIVIAADDKGNVRRLVPKSVANPLLKQAVRSAGGRSGVAGDIAKQRFESKVKAETEREVLREIYEESAGLFRPTLLHLESLSQPLKATMKEALLFLAREATERWSGAREQAFRRRGFSEGSAADLKSLREHAATLAAPELLGLVFELKLGDRLFSYGSDDGKALAKALGVPARSEVEKKVRDRLKVEAAAKKAGKSKPSAPPPKPAAKASANGTSAKRHWGPTPATDYAGWEREVRDVGDRNSEGVRTIAVKGASAEYEIAPLGGDAFALTYEFKAGSYGGRSSPWLWHPSRQACVNHFLTEARNYFRPTSLDVGDERRAKAALGKLLPEPGKEFKEPAARKRGGSKRTEPAPAKNGKAEPPPASPPDDATPAADLRGEPIAGLGLTVGELDEATHLAGRIVDGKPKSAVAVKPINVNGRPYIVAVRSSGLSIEGTRRWRLRPLYTVTDFRGRFGRQPARITPFFQQPDPYEGMLVNVRGESYAIGPASEERLLHNGKSPEKAKPKKEAARGK